MAGQPQEPWQSYSPPSADSQDTYSYPQSGARGRAYPGPAAYPGSPGYPGQDYPGQPEYPGPQDHQGAHGQAAPPWQADADPGTQPPARAKAASKGFVGSLFDFRFDFFVTPKIMKVLYVLYTVWMIIWAAFFLLIAFVRGSVFDGFFVLIVADPVFLLLTIGGFRVILELFMVIHRMHDDLTAIRERADARG